MPIESEKRRQFYKSFEAKALRSRSYLTRFSDQLTATFGSTTFLALNTVFFTAWIMINLGLTQIEPFDPFPFGFLTMVVSLEAIFLSIFVLVSQNRSAYIDSLREDLHLQVNLIAEEEVTKVLQLLAEIRQKIGINKEDPELENMLKRIDTNYIEKSIVDQMAKANAPVLKSLAHDFPEFINPMTLPAKVVSAITPNSEKPSIKSHTAKTNNS